MQLIRSRRGLSSKIAKALGLSSSAVPQWKRIPPARLWEVARITGFSLAELRPDLVCDPGPDADVNFDPLTEKQSPSEAAA